MSLVDLTGITADEPREFLPLPAGNYNVQVQEASVHTTKAGTGQYIKLKMSVVDDGEYYGRLLWQNLNIQNPHAQAQEIGLKQLRGLMDALGMKTDKLTDVNELVGKPVSAYVTAKQRKDGGGLENRVANYSLFDGSLAVPSVDNDDEIPF